MSSSSGSHMAMDNHWLFYPWPPAGKERRCRTFGPRLALRRSACDAAHI